MQHSLRLAVSLSLLVLLSGLLAPAQPAAAATFVVSNANTSGAGSLFQAITDANNTAGADNITFNLPAGQMQAGGYWRIQLASPADLLPNLSGGGTTIDGTSQLGGRSDGGPKIEISGPGGTTGNQSAFYINSANNTIRGLIINAFTGSGIKMDGAGATGNQVYGSYIGTNWDGSTGLKNNEAGITISNGASSNTIGGTGANQRNVISGNGSQDNRAQIVVESDGTNVTAATEMRGNQIVGNYIGTNASGTSAVPGSSHGILLGNNSISTVVGPSNVISGNSPGNTQSVVYGVVINGKYSQPSSAVRNIVKGNIIGLDAGGTAALSNGSGNRGGGGVRVLGVGNNLIGGTGAGEGNVISGHSSTSMIGVLIDAPCDASLSVATQVQGNIIGLNGSGTAAVPNYQGVRIAAQADIGQAGIVGPCKNVVGPGNTIAGNGADGIRIVGVLDAEDARQTQSNTIVGNRIGTNPAGTAAFGNTLNGIWVVDGTINNTIGGPGANDGNTISGNTNYGVLIESFNRPGTPTEANAPNNNLVQGNKIGTTSDRNGPLGNAQGGVLIQRSAHDNLLAGNIIGGHTGVTAFGVQIQDSGSNNNRLYGNIIGANASLSAGIANRIGVGVVGAATNNSIGESGQAQNFIIANSTYGVSLGNTSGNRVVNNAIQFNGNDGVQVNGGTGNRISATSTTQNGGNGIALINNGNNNRQAPTGLGLNSGALVGNAAGCAGCTIELFTSDTAEAGEGPIYVPTPSAVTTDGSGNFSITLPVAGCKPYLVVTVTDLSNNTSPFSQPFGPVAACQPSAADITLTAASPPNRSANPGDVLDYVHRLTNTGNAQATFTVGLNSTQGWGALVPATTSYVLDPGQFVDITVRVTVPGNAAGGVVDASTITASIPGKQVSQTDTTTVNQVFSFLFAPDRFGTVLPGNFIDYTHYITNTGNGTDNFTLSASNTASAQGVTVSFPDCNPCSLAAGASRSLRVRVTVAAGSLATSDVATITATSQGSATKQVVDTSQIQQVPVPVFDPAALNGFGKPGTTVTYTHTLRNAGGLAGTFSVNATLPANATTDGWTVSVTPPGSFALNPGETQQVTVIVSIPTYTPARTTTYSGTQVLATVTADAGAGNPTATANDNTTVLLQPALTFTPDRTSNGAPGQVINYDHTITNTGNGQETFTFATTPPAAGWSAVVLDATTQQPINSVTLARGASRNVIVQVTVATGTPVDGTTVTTATAASDGTVQASVNDATAIVVASVPRLSPGQTKNTDPGVAISFTHTITNVGNAPATTFPFSITVDVPAGWPAATITPASIPLNIGEQTTLVVTVTPPSNALARSYPITVRATATDSNAAVSIVIDTVVVNQKANLILAPSYDDLRDPDTVVTYTHTLTNSGNFTDTIGLSAKASQPWAVTLTPPQTTLAPGATARVTVTLTIPPGIPAGVKNTTYVTATSSQPAVRAIVTDTATIRAVPGLRLTPPLLQLAGEAGRPVTFTYKLLNSGSVPQSYTLAATPPAGWTATPLPATVPTLQPGQEVEVRVVVTSPDGLPRGTTGDTLLTATSSVNSPDTGTPPSATVTARLRVGPAFQLLIDPDRAAGARPGALVRYTHLLTNTGLLTDTISLSVQSLLGWEVSVSPSSATLAPGATVPVTVTVLVPTSSEAGTVDVTTVTARSTSQSDVQDTATDTTTVLRVARVNISPRENAVANPGEVVEFQHRVFNIGNSPDSFTLSYTAPAGWEVTLVQTQTIALLPGFTYPVQVRVKVPASLKLSTRASITVRATSVFDPTVYDEVVDTVGTSTTQGENPQEYPFRAFLPIIIKNP